MRIRAVIRRILLNLTHDKRTMALLFIAPIFVMFLMHLVFQNSDDHARIGFSGLPPMLESRLVSEQASFVQVERAEAESLIRGAELDAALFAEGGEMHLILEGSDPMASGRIVKVLQEILLPNQSNLTVQYIYGEKDMSLFDALGPILIGFYVFFFVFLIAGIAFLGERKSGTLQRTLTTPIRRHELLIGYLIGFGIITILQSAVITWFTIYVLKIYMIGSIAHVMVITILAALVALSVGILISAFANNEFQVVQFIPIVIIPQFFFSGLFDLSSMPPWLEAIGRVMPLYYIADALKNIMIRGKGLIDVKTDIVVLSSMALLLILFNILALKKLRRI